MGKKTKKKAKQEIIDGFEAIERLSRDIRSAAMILTRQEVRYLVDSYYIMQENRKRTANQIRAMEDSGEPHRVINWLYQNAFTLEKNVKSALDAYSANQKLGIWARSQMGIGPVIASGLLAHIEFQPWKCAKVKVSPKNKPCHPDDPCTEDCKRIDVATVGHIWRFAGLDPTMKWEKGQKRPWNARLKVICWYMGESFVKVSGKDDAFYGKIYAKRKELEVANNEAGKFAEQAAERVSTVGKGTDAYKAYSKGKLPPAHVHARAKRYAVKLFLSHYHQRGREMLGLPVPNPYPIEHLGHVHFIEPPKPLNQKGS